MKKISAMMLVVALCSMMLVACGSKGNEIVGAWEVTVTEGEATVTMEQTFLEDGTFKMSMAGQEAITLSGTYKIDGDKLTMTMTMNGTEETTTSTYKIDGDKMTVKDENGQEVVYTKKK